MFSFELLVNRICYDWHDPDVTNGYYNGFLFWTDMQRHLNKILYNGYRVQKCFQTWECSTIEQPSGIFKKKAKKYSTLTKST